MTIAKKQNNFDEVLKFYETKNYLDLSNVYLEENELPEHLIGLGAELPDALIKKSSLQTSGTMAVRLLAGPDKKLYISAKTGLLFRNLTDQQLKSKQYVPKIIPDGVHIFIIILVKDIEKKICAQMRVLLNNTTGHIQLLNKNENSKFILAAGEIYTLNGLVVLSNNKSGAYHEQLKNVNQSYYINKFLDAYYQTSANKFYAATKDDAVMEKELKRRGFNNITVDNVCHAIADCSLDIEQKINEIGDEILKREDFFSNLSSIGEAFFEPIQCQEQEEKLSQRIHKTKRG